METILSNTDPATGYALFAVAVLGALVWIHHIHTRDWNENRERIWREGGSISNHRRFSLEYHRRAIASHVAGVKRVNSHYAPDGQIPVCGIPRHRREKRAYFVPLIRLVTCTDCHEYLQAAVRAHEDRMLR